MELERPQDTLNAVEEYQPMLREIGLDARAVFERPDVEVWRSITERDNCTLDVDLAGGRHVRLHVKRFHPNHPFTTPAEDEVRGIRSLQLEGIPTVPLVAWGRLTDGRSFVITEDLAGYRDAEKLVRDGLAFEKILNATADLAGTLHAKSLHHRDLYLCHFFVNEKDPTDVRLIDAGRVRRLPGWPLRQRWIVKDLGQFWYSTTKVPVSDEQRTRWLARYAERRYLPSTNALRRAIERKSAEIARHDASPRRQKKGRDVSIPDNKAAGGKKKAAPKPTSKRK